ncbi:MAG: 30S ribosomal protein S12 methylthiotransferase RimO [Candidatus Omnitrophica bacterium]|nr:30S ribosomal protein S12 methylthiotransferase RimO [Candidatus Omnitrophota bacterium]
MKKSFTIISLGCPRNLVDSESIVSEFKEKGYAFKDNAIGVDTVIVNTCAFIEDAKNESIETILKVVDAKKAGDVKKIVVAGCLPERYRGKLKKELREIDEFRGVVDFDATFKRNSVPMLTPAHYAYIKISEGCGNRCTYCIIPYLKGPYRSRPIESVAKEAGQLVQRGIKEIVLVGQDTSLYGTDLCGRKKLAELLKELDKVSNGIWLRLLYCHPANLDKDVIKVIRDSKNICRYIDLPIEHASDRILRRMGRKTGKADIASLIQYIRRQIPDVCIRTSAIVGFPGETEKDFQELVSFIKKTRFERLGLFMYSREEGTPAYKLKAQVSEREKQRRFNEIMTLQQSISSRINERFKGRRLKVLVDEAQEGDYIARTEYDAPEVDGTVHVKGRALEPGNFYNVRITDTYEYDLVGEVL